MNDPSMMAMIPLNHGHLQTMLFLQLAAGGHMLLFVVRSRGSMISPPLPAAQLFLAIVATQIVAVLIAPPPRSSRVSVPRNSRLPCARAALRSR